MSENNTGSFLLCEICGKRMIKRLPNGLFHFAFGRGRGNKGKSTSQWVAVDIYIHGSVKMKCLSEACDHYNTFNYFPNIPAESELNGSEENKLSKGEAEHNELS